MKLVSVMLPLARRDRRTGPVKQLETVYIISGPDGLKVPKRSRTDMRLTMLK